MESVDRDEEEMEVTKDLSKLQELSDDQLVAACAGLTAHKGGRHGLNMKAKLDRIAEAEREFLAKYGGGAIQEELQSLKKEKKKKRKHDEGADNFDEVIKKKKKKKKDGESLKSDQTFFTKEKEEERRRVLKI